jgi:hypothetical protein
VREKGKETKEGKMHRLKRGRPQSNRKAGCDMDIDYGKVRGAASLPDDQFAALIYAVMVSSGASAPAALAAAANASSLKKKLEAASDKELEQLAEGFDKEALSAVLFSLQAREGQGG